MKKITLSICLAFAFMQGLKAQTDQVFINEIHYDNSSTDSNEGIELAGSAGVDLDGWSIELYNGNGGTVYSTISLSGVFNNDNDGFGFINFLKSGIQNGAPDGLALVDNDGSVIQFLSYEGVLTATDGSANGMESVDIGVSETTSTSVGHSLQLVGTGTNYSDFTWSSPKVSTPGAINSGQSFGDEIVSPEPELKLISEVQGTSISTSISEEIKVQAIVIADFQDKIDGFYIQEEDSDSDSDVLSSEGIFVYAPSGLDVSVGDLVTVTGTPEERFGLTQISSVTEITINSSELDLPYVTEVSLPVESEDYLERFEGMRIEFNQDLTVTDTYKLGRYGEVVLSSEGRLFVPTQVVSPGVDANNFQDSNDLNRIIVDDVNSSQNPDPIIFPSSGLSFNNTLRGGYVTSKVEGVMGYGFSNYRVLVTSIPVFDSSFNQRSSSPKSIDGDLRIASFNVLNYFNGDGEGGGFPTSRGADSYEEFGRQRVKIINAIMGLDADIIGLLEIENDGFGENSAIKDLVDGLNSVGAAEGVNYAFVETTTSTIGSDEIAVGLIYNTNKVSLEGNAAILDSSVDSSYNSDKNRASLLQSFKDNSSNQVINICVAHLKSKGSSCASIGDPNNNDGQGNCNLTRKAAAIAIANWMDTDPTSSGSEYNLILGDLNAYAKEDPIIELEAKGFVDLVRELNSDEEVYSYSFNGQWGTLDYALANEKLKSYVVGATEWHINADEPYILDYNTEYKSENHKTTLYGEEAFRSSDHDPVVIGLDFTSLSNENKIDTIQVGLFPNPANSDLNVVVSKSCSFEIYNVLGHSVINGNLFKGNNQIKVSELNKGMYLLQLDNGSSQKVFKFFKD